MKNEGLLEDIHGRQPKVPSTHTVQEYVNVLLESFFFYEIKRFDIIEKPICGHLENFISLISVFVIICLASVTETENIQ